MSGITNSIGGINAWISRLDSLDITEKMIREEDGEIGGTKDVETSKHDRDAQESN